MYALLVLSVALCTFGIDFQNNITLSQFTCLKNEQEKDFVILRAYRSFGAVDPSINTNLAYAKQAGFKYIDIYMFPCFKCGNPKGQVDAMIEGVKESYGMVWIDVEIYEWGTDLVKNQEFILELVRELKAKNKSIGIYSALYNWKAIVGESWNGVCSYPLWYAHYDNVKSFSDFKPFGGWTKPSIKQYSPDVQNVMCGFGVDQDFY